MKKIVAIALAGLSCALATSGADKKKSEPEVLVVADAITVPEGHRPSPGKPIYYLLGKSKMSLGEAVAGIKMPDPATVERLVVAALQTQGFVRTEVGGPIPSILILVSWGDANFADLTYRDPATDPELQKAMDQSTAANRDRRTIENLVGTNKMLSLTISDRNKVMAASNEDRSFVAISALDAEAFRKKEKKLLWRTSMTIDARKKLEDFMPLMLASAAPFFGRDAKTPVFVDDQYRRKFEVNVGDMKVLTDKESEKSPAPGDSKK